MAFTLDDVVKELRKQQKEAEETKEGVLGLLEQQRKEAEENRRLEGKREEARREAARKAGSAGTDKPTGFIQGVQQGIGEASGLGILSKWSNSILSGIFGGATAGAIMGGAGKLVGRGAIFGGASLLVGKFGEDLLNKLFDNLDPGDVVNEDFKTEFSSSLTNALNLGLIGGIFGRRIGLSLFTGSLIGDAIKSMFDEEALKSNFISGFGLDVRTEDIVTYGSMIAAFFGPALIGNALNSQFSGAKFDPKSNRWRSPYGGYMSEANAKAFNKQFRPKMSFGGRVGWAAVIGVAGATLAGFISTHMGEGMGEVTSWGMTGASLGMMFGPQGAIAGALIGFALAGGAKVFEWLNKTRKNNLDKLDKEIDKLQAEAQALADKGDLEGAYKKARESAGLIDVQAQKDSKAASAAQGMQTYGAMLGLYYGQRDQRITTGAAISATERMFSSILASDMSKEDKIAAARKALQQYMGLTQTKNAQIAFAELQSQMPLGQSKNLAMGLMNPITQNITIGQVGDTSVANGVGGRSTPVPTSISSENHALTQKNLAMQGHSQYSLHD